MRLLGDSRGAIMVVGVFMAAFMAGSLLHMASLGEAIYQRERLQDAADSGAFGAAVTYARGMNVIVLVNLVMAALLALLVTLRVVQILADFAILVLLGLSWVTAGGSLAAVPPLKSISAKAASAHTKLKRPVFSALKVLNTAANVTRSVVPVVAQGAALRAGGDDDGGSGFSFAVPSRLTLPVEDDAFDVLCGKGGEFAAELVLMPIEPVVPDSVLDEVTDGMGSITQRTADWFCGKTDGKPPSLKRRIRRLHPRPKELDGCEQAVEGLGQDDSLPRECREAVAAWERSEPGPEGQCLADCGRRGAYARRAARARIDCDPTTGKPFTGYWWREQTYQVSLRKTKLGWREEERRRYERPRLVRAPKASRDLPCGTGFARYSAHWEEDPEEPLCAEPWEPPPRGTRATVRVVVVEDVFRCMLKEEVEISPRDEGSGDRDTRREAGSGKEHSPKRVEAGAELGSEDFMLRVIAVSPGSDAPPLGAQVGSWERRGSAESEVEEESEEERDLPPSIAIAQAEYFYDDRAEPSEMMWRMLWRARLRRVRWPDPSAGSAPDVSRSALEKACVAGDSKERGCGRSMKGLEGWAKWMVH